VLESLRLLYSTGSAHPRWAAFCFEGNAASPVTEAPMSCGGVLWVFERRMSPLTPPPRILQHCAGCMRTFDVIVNDFTHAAVLAGWCCTGMPKAGQFWGVFWPAVTAQVGFWATLSLNISDFTRHARSQKAQVRCPHGAQPQSAARKRIQRAQVQNPCGTRVFAHRPTGLCMCECAGSHCVCMCGACLCMGVCVGALTGVRTCLCAHPCPSAAASLLEGPMLHAQLSSYAAVPSRDLFTELSHLGPALSVIPGHASSVCLSL